jgi:hypothetical protein
MIHKIFTLFFVSLFFLESGSAQLSGRTTYANTIDIKDGNNTIIAKMVVIPGLKREMFLKSYFQTKDSLGLYVYTFSFSKPNHLEAKNFAVVLQFNNHFENVYYTSEGPCQNFTTTSADNKLGTSFHSSSLQPDCIISVKIISEKPILATISGISGQL